MYTITKTMEIAGSHCLRLSYDSPCQRLHGHGWKIQATVAGKELNKEGMLVDFAEIKKVVYALDHRHLNDVMASGDDPKFNPTAENIARWIATSIDAILPFGIKVTKVVVQECEGNVACYEP